VKVDVRARIRRPNGFTLDAAFACESDALAVVGPSGSGKSTLLEAIAGIEPGARVLLDGKDCSPTPLHRRDLGYVRQDALLFPHLSVRSNLLYSPRASGIEPVVEALGIAHLLDRMPRHLSGGERRRVALARAIVSRPVLLLLDEPFAGLDEPRRREAVSLLDRARRSFSISMILVSHLADEVASLTTWAVRLEEGRVAASGPSLQTLRAGETAIDNHFEGEAVAPGRVRVGDVELVVAAPAQGRVRLACYAHDILLALEPPRAISARNCFRARIASISGAAGAVVATLEAPPLRVLLTPQAVEELALQPGREVIVIIKATSIAVMGPAW
jgi:molybdate transport system ATP-binding protein